MPLFRPNIKKMKEKGDVKSLINLLVHDKPSIRLEAVRALPALKHLKAFTKALKNDLPLVRAEAASMLDNIDFSETTRLLCQFILYETEVSVWQQGWYNNKCVNLRALD